MTRPVDPDSTTAQQPAQQAGQQQPKRATSPWVKLLLGLGVLSIVWGIALSTMSTTINIEASGRSNPTDLSFSCGTMWSPDDSEAVEWATAWKSREMLPARSNGITLPDMPRIIAGDCAQTISNRENTVILLIGVGVILLGVGAIARRTNFSGRS